jgi:hypothetical protein
MTIIVFFAHRENIKRLMKKKELGFDTVSSSRENKDK